MTVEYFREPVLQHILSQVAMARLYGLLVKRVIVTKDEWDLLIDDERLCNIDFNTTTVVYDGITIQYIEGMAMPASDRMMGVRE